MFMGGLKLLFLNAGYCLGLDGSTVDYILKSYRYVYCPGKIRNDIYSKIKSLAVTESPDVFCMAEVDKGSFNTGFDNQILKLTSKKEHFFDISVKYGKDSFLRKFPLSSGKANGFVSKEKLKFKKIYFKNGTKKLIYEIYVKGFTILLAHFSLKKKVREKQFDEIVVLMKNKKKMILCGDFNIFGGLSEVDNLLKGANLKIANKKSDFTFPACKPDKILDLFICSKDVKVNKIKVIQSDVSDHLPVLIDIS